MMPLLQKRVLRLVTVALVLMVIGCTRRDYRVETRMDAHGRPTMKKVQYTPEELAARDAAMGYAPRKPVDPDLASIEEIWSKLTLEQRQELLRTARGMISTP